MATRPADGRNPAKTKLQAQTSKEKVATSKAALRDAQRAQWLKKAQDKAKKIDPQMAQLEKAAKVLEGLIKKQEDNAKLRELIEHQVHHLIEVEEEMHKEVETHAEVRVSGHAPKMPHGAIPGSSLVVLAFSVIGFWKLIKAKLK